MKLTAVFCILFLALQTDAQDTRINPEGIGQCDTAIMIEVNKTGVNLNGVVRISKLASKGRKQVWVDDKGILNTDDGPGTEAVTSFYTVGPGSFSKTNSSTTSTLFNQVYRVFLSTGATESIIAPLNLPHGVIVKSMRVVLKDNSDQDLKIQLLYTKIDIAGSFVMGQITTSGNSTAETSLSIPLANLVNNDTEYYSISIVPVSGDTWANSLLYIKAVIFTYE